ncbi:MAG: hypothetical protein A2186_02150 [Candidatus Levybacteria bacterium RIFOXYA1_FULL_41_10]|nr:MAG: hypothetical protein UU15_C0009G0015 [Candidatus Levybacteria bacterium GW2011_GWC2_40_7]KKR94695.1 MAG: hypothetical protein UU45_C0008G0095 [Candidatus Levybacteria bacterium GW2011_GWA2_41_15]KKS01740.1 MAG: hypothetical protein UU52_C0008G0021 [Candidatus Levybacteria bacterium GW2011_GWB1_41_21]OGH20184.1 MAG: hypothetical protein A2695_03250 [Candidatus Levybacteria bacterium RIFCSPHIGHO2_01_FULL_40_83]OGH25893.1 MAG: hypothetical protein A3D82_04405 [Candidatus Levybacteria bacte
MAEDRPSRREIAIAGGITTTVIGGLLVGAALHEKMRPHPQATEIYQGGAVIVNLERADGRTSLDFPSQYDPPNTVDESSLTVNGQSLSGVEEIRVNNPEIVKTHVIRSKANPQGEMLSILIPFDGGTELYYVYGEGGVSFDGKGEFIPGSETPDGGFRTETGKQLPPQEVSVVKVIPNNPTTP